MFLLMLRLRKDDENILLQTIFTRAEDGAKLIYYPAEQPQTSFAVVICPGGGYSWLSPREEAPVAEMYSKNGVQSFVLEYDVSHPPLKNRPLCDLSWAMQLIRNNAEKFNIDNDKICVCGFSAGGHLAASLGVFWNDKKIFPISDIRAGHRPNALILCYPVITYGKFSHKGSFEHLFNNENERGLFSLEKKVNSYVPPSFIWHTFDDNEVPVQNSLMFANALIQNNIECEIHIYRHGVHGLSLATPKVSEPIKGRLPDSHVATWLDLSIGWMNSIYSGK